MGLNVEQIMTIVLGGLILHAAVAFLSLSEVKQQIRGLREAVNQFRAALGMDGENDAMFVRRREFEDFAVSSREDRKEIHEDMRELKIALDKLSDALNALRRNHGA